MAGNVDHVIDATHDPVVAILVASGAVAGEVDAWNLRPVLAYVAIGIAVNGAQHAWPRLLNDEETAGTFGHGLPIHGDDFGHDAWYGTSRRSRFRRDCTGQRRNHDVASL